MGHDESILYSNLNKLKDQRINEEKSIKTRNRVNTANTLERNTYSKARNSTDTIGQMLNQNNIFASAQVCSKKQRNK